MKTVRGVFFCLILLVLLNCLPALGQIQHGMVKTRGRMVSGHLQSGKAISGAVINIKDQNALVSNNDGKFSFPSKTRTYVLQSVRKNGYQLVDCEICRMHHLSENPLYLVMETPGQQRSDMLNAERKIRRNLQTQLEQKENEIEALAVSIEKKDSLLQILYQQQGDNEKLIAEMARRYATTDYDTQDDFYRQVNCFIENGELTRADSLLGTRGDISSQVRDIIQQGGHLHDAEEKLNKAKNVHLMDVNEASLRCLGYYDSMKLKCQYDSAAYYLRLYTDLDSTNVMKLVNLGDFEDEYLDDGYGFRYYEKALYLANKTYDNQSVEVGICNNRVGEWYSKDVYKNAYKAEEHLKKALNVLTAAYGENHSEVARCYYNFGQMYISRSRGVFGGDDEYENALDSAKCNLNKAMMVYSNLYGENSMEVASCHLKLYELTSDEKYRNNALKIYQSINDGENSGLGDLYYQVGLEHYGNRYVYTPSVLGYFFENQSKYDDSTAIIKQMEDYEMAIVYLRNARSVYEKILSQKYPRCKEIDSIVVQIEHEIELFKKALKTGDPLGTLLKIWNE